MKMYTASTTINASPEAIWAILTHASGFAEWDPDVVRIEGEIVPDGKVTAYTKLSDRAFPVKVSEFVPGKKMVWSSGMPLGLFKGARTFSLESQADGSTKYSVREEFSGPLLFLFGRTIPDLTPSFERHVAGLKARAEAGV